jgi:hypothetical protein
MNLYVSYRAALVSEKKDRIFTLAKKIEDAHGKANKHFGDRVAFHTRPATKSEKKEYRDNG